MAFGKWPLKHSPGSVESVAKTMAYRDFLIGTLALVCQLSWAPEANAGAEEVSVIKVMNDKAIIRRSNGETYLIEKGVGCLSLWRHEGKKVLISSPGLFLGVGSRLLIPDADQQCRIWDSKRLSDAASPGGLPDEVTPRVAQPTTEERAKVSALQKALKIVGAYSGPTDGVLTEDTKKAIEVYRGTKGYPATEAGLRLAILSLALDVLKKRPQNNEATEISKTLSSVADSSRDNDSGCKDKHWVKLVSSDGQVVVLEDGSVWEIDVLERIDTMLWLPTDNILVCGNKLVNIDSSDSVTAVRIKQ